MTVVLFFLAAVGAVIIWWSVGQRLTSKPWLEASPVGMVADEYDPPSSPARIGLYVFLGVVGALFSLSISAYFMRMGGSDWTGMPVAPMLWINTAFLASASGALQWVRAEVRRDRMESVRPILTIALLLAWLFLVGQIYVWRDMTASGYLLAANPANSFFYMLTGMHGVHILGGGFFLSRLTAKSFATHASAAQLRLSIDLCALYFHFMLAVWIVLFSLFAGWASNVIDLCRQLLT
jgi:cytochrome c oxidase subunit III